MRRIAFRLAAIGAAAAASIHLTALTVPAFARAAYPPGYPTPPPSLACR